VASLDSSRLIATSIRDVLKQHGDIFSIIDPQEIPGQLIARLRLGEPAIEAYLEGLELGASSRLEGVTCKLSLGAKIFLLET
jgi:hypothetical protein